MGPRQRSRHVLENLALCPHGQVDPHIVKSPLHSIGVGVVVDRSLSGRGATGIIDIPVGESKSGGVGRQAESVNVELQNCIGGIADHPHVVPVAGENRLGSRLDLFFHHRRILLTKNQGSVRHQIQVHIGVVGVAVDGLPENLDILCSGDSADPVRPHPKSDRVTAIVRKPGGSDRKGVCIGGASVQRQIMAEIR